MKRTILVFFCTLQLFAKPVIAQEDITLDMVGMTLPQAFEAIKDKYGYHFIYVEGTLEGEGPVALRVRGTSISEVVDKLLLGRPLAYSITDKVIVLTRRAIPREGVVEVRQISGTVKDAETGEGVTNASISFIGHAVDGGMATVRGEFAMNVPASVDSIQWSALGYHPHVEKYDGYGSYHILLRRMVMDMEEVVVTGIVERKKANYTSATQSLSGAELKQIGNASVINSLRTLDPSFIVVANNLQGSNPNRLAQIEMRGKTSLSSSMLESQYSLDPNLPLFILDGFESSLEQITDMDINRIESVTLLKDAASSALYGARSANGVVVVETRKPSAGKFRLFYNNDTNIEVADLSDYNMMSAEEKLEFELRSGRYEFVESSQADPLALSRAYNDRLRKVLQGVNHYWLDVPLRTGHSLNHSLYLQHGVGLWYYGIGGNWKTHKGVMRGSGRDTWGVSADVGYKHQAWNVLASTWVSGFRASETPASDFSSYVKQSPLYMDVDTGKHLDRIPFADRLETYREPNYIYNALLNSFARRTTWNIQQQISVSWRPTAQWEISSRIQVGANREDGHSFISPKDTRFDYVNPLERGSYTFNQGKQFAYQGSVMALWNKQFGDNHFLILNLRTEIQQHDVNYRGYQLEGFPPDADGNPRNSNAPAVLRMLPSPPIIRRVNGLASANYVFAGKYFIDGTVRLDGSTQFGTANRYAMFWSAGTGWNLHREPFLNGIKALDILRLRINTGLTGNQSFGSFYSTVVYESIEEGGISVPGIVHHSLGNPNLEWQNTFHSNVGIDVDMWKSRFTFTGNFFLKNTNPLIATLDLPPSTGVEQYAMNVGGLKSMGFEGVVRFVPVRSRDGRIRWSLGATMLQYKSRYENLSGALMAANESLMANNSLYRYMDGYSPDDLWAVRSLGIDPTTGREVFLNREGQHTFEYNIDDLQAIGNSRPWAEGVLNTFFSYKSMTLGLHFRYSLNGSRFNEALYEKVENISFEDLSSNQDRRALYDRWQKEGDASRFRGISLLEDTPMSSRFIQRESFLSGESISVGVVLDRERFKLLRRVGIQQVSIMAYANDIFRWSNLLAERGVHYPFSRNVSFSFGIMI